MSTWKLTARDLTRKPDLVIPDVPAPGLPTGAPLIATVILYPKVKIKTDVGAYALSGVGSYKIRICAGTGFICTYGLPLGVLYPSEPNNVLYVAQNDWLTGGFPTLIPEFATSNMNSANAPFHIPWVYGHGKMLVRRVGPGLVTGTDGMVFKDNHGNRAYVMPLIVLDANYNVVLDCLCPEISITQISSTSTVCKVRVIVSHAAPASAEFSNVGIGMALPTGRLTDYADPADPSNVNKRIVELGAGVFTFSAVATHADPIRGYVGGEIHSVLEVK